MNAHHIMALLLLLLGGAGVYVSLVIPHREDFSEDRSVFSAIIGAAWLGICVAGAFMVLQCPS